MVHGARGLAAILFVGMAAAGCVVEERIKGTGERIYHSDYEDGYEDKQEAAFLEETEDNPDDSRAWWALGDYYERTYRYLPARTAYLRMQECIEADEERLGRKFTGGLYLLGRIHSRLKMWEDAVAYLERVLAEQPERISDAALATVASFDRRRPSRRSPLRWSRNRAPSDSSCSS